MKKLLLLVAVLVVVVLGAVAALVLFVNPNQFKPLIVEQTKKQTGLDLMIEGDIGWKFFPSIGFEIGKTELKNPQGFTNPNMFKVDNVGVDVSVMPLLDKQLVIGNVQLDGAEIYLETLKDGRTNLDSLTKAKTSQEVADTQAPAESKSPSPTPEQTSGVQDWTIQLAGVTVNNALLDIQDRKAGTQTKLYDVQLKVDEFEAEKWTLVSFAAKGRNDQQKNNPQNFAASGSAEVKLSSDFTQYALRNINVDASFSDQANNIESAKLALVTFDFDKPNALEFSVKGKAADMMLEAKGSSSLVVNKEITKVAANGFTLEANLQGAALPQSPMKVGMQSDIAFDISKNTLNVVLAKLTANALQFDGKLDVALADIPKVRFSLHSPDIDVDAFLGNDKAAATSSSETASEKPASTETKPATTSKQEVEPDLSALQTLDVAGDITIDKLKANNAKMQNVKADVVVNRGLVTLKSFTANLYQGSVSASALVDTRKTPATYTVKKSVKGVKVQPMLMDVLDNDMLEGTGNIEVNAQGKSLTPTGIQKNLVGTVAINFADGAVNGINVAHLLRTNYAKITGGDVTEADHVKKTDFSAMTATLKLDKGNITTDDLHMQSPALRIRGQGKANYLDETVDFTLSTSVVGSLKGQGGKDVDELRDVTIPVNISGKWSEPKYKLVFDDVLKQKAKKEVDRGIEKLSDKIKDEDTKKAVDSLLKGLFN
ncbi:AsmA family protein [Vibrio diazotrophicus]|uniref:AsmA family protein n=1 Tax=Vibrio diazotrophicus TaxID=685 RepID=A0A329EP94_VIBDI|nr:AsmA family protein [Vibrio diazotrophicus]PNH99368.1 AsmA family protein [Vibrio diazotrophicus]RAS67824.1 AsmA protein [Vibrio diazotrophicus]